MSQNWNWSSASLNSTLGSGLTVLANGNVGMGTAASQPTTSVKYEAIAKALKLETKNAQLKVASEKLNQENVSIKASLEKIEKFLNSKQLKLHTIFILNQIDRSFAEFSKSENQRLTNHYF